jgi:hypothetical protein
MSLPAADEEIEICPAIMFRLHDFLHSLNKCEQNKHTE